jgi:hypothetical protein
MVVKWSQRYRATGSVSPGKMGGHRKPVLEPHYFLRHAVQGFFAQPKCGIAHCPELKAGGAFQLLGLPSIDP